MTKYTYIVILNVPLMIHSKNVVNAKKLYAYLQTLDFKIESYHPNINVVLYNLNLYVFKIVLLY